MHPRQLGNYFLLVLLIGALVLAFFILQPFLAPLALAAVFAVVLQPLHRRVLKSMPHWPSLASLVTVLISGAVTLIVLSLLGTQVGLEARDLYTDFVRGDARAQIFSITSQLEHTIVGAIPAAEGFARSFSTDVASYAESALQWLLQHLADAFTSIATLVLKFLVFFIALYYLLRDGAKLKHIIVELSPLRDTYDEKIFDRLEVAVNSVIRGSLMIALIQGTMTAIGFTIFGVPNPVLWGSVAAIGAMIPAVGTGIVFIPAVIFMLFTGNLGAAAGLTVWGFTAVGLVDNFLGPQLIGRGIKLHPLIILLSVLGGLAFFGPIGLFLGPLSLSLLFAFLSIYSEVSRNHTSA